VHSLDLERRQDVGGAVDPIERARDLRVLALIDHRAAAALAEVGLHDFHCRPFVSQIAVDEFFVLELRGIRLFEPVHRLVDEVGEVFHLPLADLPRLSGTRFDTVEVGIALHAGLAQLRGVFSKFALGTLRRAGEGGEVDDGVG